MPNQTVKVLIADAHSCSRIGLVQVLLDAGLEVVAEASSVAECLQLLAKHQPSLLLLACNLLPTEPLSFVNTLRQGYFNCHIVLCLVNCDGLPLQALLDAGVKGMVAKEEPIQMLMQVIHTGVAGQIGLSPMVINKLFQPESESVEANTLDDLERKLLQLICAEKNNLEIARILSLSRKTVEKQLTALYAKLGVHSRTGAALWFERHQAT